MADMYLTPLNSVGLQCVCVCVCVCVCACVLGACVVLAVTTARRPAVTEMFDYKQRVQTIKDLVRQLPRPNQDTMQVLFKHLRKYV